MWASGLARARLLCSPFSRALCVPVVRLVQYSADRSTGVHHSRPTLGVYHTAPVLPVLWANGFRLSGSSCVVVVGRPTSMAYYATVSDVFVQFGQPRAVLSRRLARPHPAEQPAYVHLGQPRTVRAKGLARTAHG